MAAHTVTQATGAAADLEHTHTHKTYKYEIHIHTYTRIYTDIHIHVNGHKPNTLRATCSADIYDMIPRGTSIATNSSLHIQTMNNSLNKK